MTLTFTLGARVRAALPRRAAAARRDAHCAAHVRRATLTPTLTRDLLEFEPILTLTLTRYVGLRGGQWRLALALSLDQDFGDGAFD